MSINEPRRPGPQSRHIWRIRVDYFHAANGKRANFEYFGLYASKLVAERSLNMLAPQLNAMLSPKGQGIGKWTATFEVAPLAWTEAPEEAAA